MLDFLVTVFTFISDWYCFIKAIFCSRDINSDCFNTVSDSEDCSAIKLFFSANNFSVVNFNFGRSCLADSAVFTNELLLQYSQSGSYSWEWSWFTVSNLFFTFTFIISIWCDICCKDFDTTLFLSTPISIFLLSYCLIFVEISKNSCLFSSVYFSYFFSFSVWANISDDINLSLDSSVDTLSGMSGSNLINLDVYSTIFLFAAFSLFCIFNFSAFNFE